MGADDGIHKRNTPVWLAQAESRQRRRNQSLRGAAEPATKNGSQRNAAGTNLRTAELYIYIRWTRTWRVLRISGEFFRS